VVHQVLRKNNISFILEINPYVCDSCQLAKSHQLPYHVSTVPLEQVFSDVWGLAPVSVNKHLYYVSFIDDYSKFTWIYLLKKRSDVYQVFLNFQQLVERKFNRKIITMQTDWGGEYENLHSFFQKVGITHHVSCPHAHQQNGSAERKHHHIVEVGLSLLAHASMPLKFWDEAFLTATCLINMLSSIVIDFATPVEKLLQTKPNYDSLRIFGCACWPNLRPYNKRKLAFRSKQCVFLGYSPRHKGVKCLDVKAGRVYISRDVVFDENVFPFASLHPNAGQILRHELHLLPPDISSSHVGDRQIYDPMTLSILPVATNPTQHPAEITISTNSSSDDEDFDANHAENDLTPDNSEEDSGSTRFEADPPSPSDQPHSDPDADSPRDPPPGAPATGQPTSSPCVAPCMWSRSLSPALASRRPASPVHAASPCSASPLPSAQGDAHVSSPGLSPTRTTTFSDASTHDSASGSSVDDPSHRSPVAATTRKTAIGSTATRSTLNIWCAAGIYP
jgi:hypothetical protein